MDLEYHDSEEGDDDGEKDMTLDEVDKVKSLYSGASMPHPTATAMTDMDLDEDPSALFHRDAHSHDPKDESFEQSVDPSAPPPAQRQLVDGPSSLASSVYCRPHAGTPLFGPGHDEDSHFHFQTLVFAAAGTAHRPVDAESSMPDDSQDNSHSRRLTDISDLKSSMEMQESSQIVVEPTQVEYDIEVYNKSIIASGNVGSPLPLIRLHASTHTLS